MSDLWWKLKQWVRKALPVALIVGLLYGGYSLFKQGTFRHGPKFALLSLLHKMPYFGSRFRHYKGYSAPSYAYSGKKRYRRGHKSYYRHGRRYHRRRR